MKIGKPVNKKDIHYIRITKAVQPTYWYAKHVGKIIPAVKTKSEWYYVYKDGNQYVMSSYSLNIMDCVRQRKMISSDVKTNSIVKISNWNRSYKDNTVEMLNKINAKITGSLTKDLFDCVMNGAKAVHYRSSNHIIANKPELFSDENMIHNCITITIEIKR